MTESDFLSVYLQAEMISDYLYAVRVATLLL